MEELLKKLIETSSVSGCEENLRDFLIKQIKPYVDETRVDKIGNVIFKKGSGRPKIMINAHMDEIGLMVKHIDEKGFIKFSPVGGVDKKILPGQIVKIHGSKKIVSGVIGFKPIHVQKKEEMEKIPKIDEMFIDVAAKKDKDVASLGISVGDFVSFSPHITKLFGSRVCGNGFDDRVGCLMMIEIVKKLKNFKGTLYAVGSVKEEIGLVGIRGAAFGINPDIAISLDVTIAGDDPYLKPGESLPVLGKGPALLIKDAVAIVQKNVRKWIESVAKENKINIQYDIMDNGATDSSILPMIREGIPSAAVLIPSRYVHTPVEIIDMSDVKEGVKLVSLLVKTAHKYFK